MGKGLKKIIFLDFEKEFFASFLKLLLFWNPFWTLLVSLASGGGNLASVVFKWEWSLSEATLVGLFGMAVLGGFRFMEKEWSAWMSRPKPVHGMGWHLLLLAVTIPPGLVIALRLMIAYINLSYPGNPIPADFQWKYYETEIFASWMLLLVCFLFKSLQDLRDQSQLAQLRAEELEKERLRALLSKLQDQLNPHFLFNTLNTVASLIHEDPVKAERILLKLSTLFQGVLSATRESSHSLEKELDFCRDYLEIEQARFGKRLKTSIQAEKGVEPEKVMVPVLLLQPLVENAVKHGLASRAKGGNLWVGAGRQNGSLKLWVEDDGVGFGNSPYAGNGTALENCRRRLELSFGKEGQLEIFPREKGGTKVSLTLPLAGLGTAPLEET